MINRNRHSIRLAGYNYSSSGWYFVTICTHKREHLFGEILNEIMTINELGEITETVCKSLPIRYPVNLDSIQIMPNHIHFIVEIVVGAHHDASAKHHDAPICESVGIRESVSERAIRESPLRRSLLSAIIGYLKMNSSKIIHTVNPNIIVWQRNYYERVIRNEKELNDTRRYIIDNPINWETDIENTNM